jgi:Phytanoyl-CoA dioxygenase (PhyH)
MLYAAGIRAEFANEGRVWLRRAVPQDELRRIQALSELGNRPGARVPGSSRLFSAVSCSPWSSEISRIWPDFKPVRLLTFDKTPETNWSVPWHQDRVVAVKGQADVPGYSNWSRKTGTWHCEPPVDFLQRMLFVRVHIDGSDADNGAMEIALGSHRAGLVASDEAAAFAQTYKTEICVAEPGDILVLAMLTLHRSNPSTSSASRRALRLDYSADDLPVPLAWA